MFIPNYSLQFPEGLNYPKWILSPFQADLFLLHKHAVREEYMLTKAFRQATRLFHGTLFRHLMVNLRHH